MNKQRRKEITRALDLIAEAKNIIEYAMGDEQDAFDHLPDGIRCSDKGDEMEENVYSLDYAFDSLEVIEEELDKFRTD